jgi:hypothetical protein
MKRSVGLALAALSLTTACIDHGRKDSAVSGPLRVVSGLTSGFGVNGRGISWEASARVLAADLDSGRRTFVANSAGGNSPVPMALSRSTVLWLDVTGGNSQGATLFTASPLRGRKLLAEWYPDTYTSEPTGTLFGGVAGQGRTLAYALYKLSPPGGNPDACYEKPCRRRVAGGGVFQITPGSLAINRVLPPAQAIAATDQSIAAAVLRPRSIYATKAQVVVKDLSRGTQRTIGKPASVLALGLDHTHVVALIGPENGSPKRLRLWSLATGRLLRSFAVPEVERVVVLAGSHVILRLGGTIFTINLRSGRRQVISHYRPKESSPRYGPWVSAGRVLWVESYRDTKPHSLIRSAPLPDPDD